MTDQDLTTLLLRLGKGFGLLGRQLPRILHDPRSYPRESMLMALMALLLLVLVVLIGFAVFDAVATSVERRRLGLHATKRGRLRRFAAVASVFAALAVTGVVMPSTHWASESCDGCHATKKLVAGWKKDTHRTVGCYGCHAKRGPIGTLAASANGLSNIIGSKAESKSGSSRGPSFVFSSSCLSCHSDLRDRIVGHRVKMRHRDVIEADIECMECHPRVGHGERDESKTAVMRPRETMSVCVTCHDGKRASSECDTCHGGHPLDQAVQPKEAATPLRLQCKGCHATKTQDKCIKCHGLELPHDGLFVSQHAGRSWKDPALCARCHEAASARQGCGCHTGEGEMHGQFEGWFPRHGAQAQQSGRFGCNCHDIAFCTFCHPTSPFPGYR